MVKKEQIPIVIDMKNNYGSAGNNNNTTRREGIPNSPSLIYCLHGTRNNLELRGHCHRQRSEGVDVTARKKLIIASILCVFFMVAEVVGGVLSNSLAIATDAAHLLTDFASFMISLFAIWLAGRPSTQRLSFGWYRAEVIGALVSVLLIWVITAILVLLAIRRVITRDFEVDAKIMLITSALAIIVNLIMGFQLHHGHSHGNAPVDTPTPTTSTTPAKRIKDKNHSKQNGNADVHKRSVLAHMEGENINVRAAFIHVLGDVLQSVGVFVAALVIYFKPDWSIADPICTFIFSVIVLFTTFAIIKDAILVLMEGTPSYMDYEEVMNIFLSIDGVKRVHNLRIWALSINKIALSAHLVIAPGADPKKILDQATTAVHYKYNFFETTIQIEEFTPAMDNCQHCTAPIS